MQVKADRQDASFGPDSFDSWQLIEVWEMLEQARKFFQECLPMKVAVEKYGIGGLRAGVIDKTKAQIMLLARPRRIGELVLVKIYHCRDMGCSRRRWRQEGRPVEHTRPHDQFSAPGCRT